MAPPDIDKAYVKKHKINDMLNELFSELNSNKPENPVEFAMKHFEAKLPPKTSSSRRSSLLASKIPPLDQQFSMSSQQQPPLSTENNLLSKFMSRARDNQASRDGPSVGMNINLENVLNKLPISTLNIINKLERINAKVNREVTNEELLDKENINYVKKQDELDEDEASKNKKVIVRYKNELKNREDDYKHKNDIRSRVENELRKQNDPRVEKFVKLGNENVNRMREDDGFGGGGGGGERENYHLKKDPFIALKEDEENEDLENEILTAHNCTRKDKSSKKRKHQKIANFITGAAAAAAAADGQQPKTTPQVKLIICQICSKIQSNILEEKNDFANKEFQSVLNEKQSMPILSAKEPIKAETLRLNEPATTKKEDVVNTLGSSPFLDFFKASIGKGAADDKKIDNLDDDPIESASQVSGPRHIEPYEPKTNRSNQSEINKSSKESGVLAWVMARQASVTSHDEEKNEEKKKPQLQQEAVKKEEKTPSRPGSAVGSNRGAGSNVSRQSHSSTLVGSKTAGGGGVNTVKKVEERPKSRDSNVSTERKKEETATSVLGEQQWKLHDDKSDTSSVTRKNVQKKT